jgi:PAS domain S-box-containing protein
MIAIPPSLARRVLDAAPDAMVIIDAFGTIWFANRRVCTLFGYEHDDLIGESIDMLMAERLRAEPIDSRGNLVSSVCVRSVDPELELHGQRSDGAEFPIEISLSPIDDVGQSLVAAAIRDVTHVKRIEAELIVARDAIEAMRELAERANQGRERYLEAASHDLRQPLQNLVRLNSALRRHLTTPAALEVVAQQGQAIGVMSRLLNDLLDISKLESGAIKPEPTDFTVAALVEELRAEFTGIAANKGLQLEIQGCDGSAHGDPALVEHILRNLIANAIKSTHEGGVRLHCLREAAFVRIEVLDTGVVGPAAGSDENCGLELSIAQRLANLASLELDVRSEVGRRSTISIVLPAS